MRSWASLALLHGFQYGLHTSATCAATREALGAAAAASTRELQCPLLKLGPLVMRRRVPAARALQAAPIVAAAAHQPRLTRWYAGAGVGYNAVRQLPPRAMWAGEDSASCAAALSLTPRAPTHCGPPMQL